MLRHDLSGLLALSLLLSLTCDLDSHCWDRTPKP